MRGSCSLALCLLFSTFLCDIYLHFRVGNVETFVKYLRHLCDICLHFTPVFSITSNSAGAERVFSLLKLMYGPNQMDLLSDAIEAGLMLRHNARVIR